MYSCAKHNNSSMSFSSADITMCKNNADSLVNKSIRHKLQACLGFFANHVPYLTMMAAASNAATMVSNNHKETCLKGAFSRFLKKMMMHATSLVKIRTRRASVLIWDSRLADGEDKIVSNLSLASPTNIFNHPTTANLQVSSFWLTYGIIELNGNFHD